MVQERIYSFNRYLQELFGQRVQRISLDAGFSCPNIDGTLSDKGCLYCNHTAFASSRRRQLPLEQQIQDSIDYWQRRCRLAKFIAYFQSYSNTNASLDILRQSYEVIKKYPQIVGLSIATRPDCVDEDKIRLIASYQRDYLVWVEYGLQTTDDGLLKGINRNHTYQDFLSALSLSRRYGLNVGIHLILGLPQANRQTLIVDIERISQLDIQGIKFHVLHVLKDTALAQDYQAGRVRLLSEDEYVHMVCDFLERIPKTTVILRLVSTAAKHCLIGPLWMNNKHRVIQSINHELGRRKTSQGYYFSVSDFAKAPRP